MESTPVVTSVLRRPEGENRRPSASPKGFVASRRVFEVFESWRHEQNPKMGKPF